MGRKLSEFGKVSIMYAKVSSKVFANGSSAPVKFAGVGRYLIRFIMLMVPSQRLGVTYKAQKYVYVVIYV